MRLQIARAHLLGQAFVPQLVLEHHGAEHVYAVDAGQQVSFGGDNREQVFVDLGLNDRAGQGLGLVAAVEQALLRLAHLFGQAGVLLVQKLGAALIL
ncbi:hypothetical protein D3C81_1715850 [compost metagenome]